MDKEIINQIDGYVNQDNELMLNENKRIYQKYYNWLGINGIACKDEVEYKMVYLICAYFYFEQKSFIRDADLSMNDYIDTRFIFKNAYNYLSEIKIKDIENSSFSEKTKEILKRIIYEPNVDNMLLMYRGFCSKHFFKEKMVREYLYYLFTKPIQDDLEICDTIRKLSSYNLCKNKDTEIKNNRFLNNIIDGVDSIVSGDLDSSPKSVVDLDEFEIFKTLKYSAGGEEKLIIKADLDYHFYMVLLWLYQHNYSEFDYYEQQLENYFKYFKSDTEVFRKMFESLLLKKAMKEALKEYKDDGKSYEELVLSKICDNANEQEIRECEEKLVEYGLKISDIKEKKTNWYENIIQGEYFCSKVEKLYMNDYSLAVASWSICVEDMLYEKIYKKIENTSDDTLRKKIQESIKYKHSFTLGTIHYLCKNEEYNNSKDKKAPYYDDYIVSVICNEINYKNKEAFKKLISGIHKLTDIRNKADHRIPVSSELVEKCRELVFISTKIIKTLYEDF